MKTGIIIIGLCMMSAVINHDVVTVKTGENFVINLQKPGRFKRWNVVEPDTGYIQFIKTTSDENPDGYDRFYFKALSEGTRPLRFNLKYTLGTEMNITEKEFRINIESSEKNPTPIITTPDIAKKEDDVMKPIDTS